MILHTSTVIVADGDSVTYAMSQVYMQLSYHHNRQVILSQCTKYTH